MHQITLSQKPANTRPALKSEGGKAQNKRQPDFTRQLILVLGCLLALYVSLALGWNKFSRAEVFFAECAREMLVLNNWVTPLYQGKPFFDKPILVYWLILCMYKLFGVAHLTARIPSIIAALATTALTAVATKNLALKNKDKAGIAAAVCTGSSFMFLSFAYNCMSDIWLVLFDTITLVLLYRGAADESKRTSYFMLASGSMGLAFITKGPIGIVLPAAAFAAYLLCTGRLKIIKPMHVLAGGAIATLIAVPWFFAAYKANGSWALAYFFIRENFQRYAGSTYDTHKPVWFMLVSLITGFLPWSIFLPATLKNFISDLKNERAAATEITVAPSGNAQRQLYLWIWIAVVVGFFSFSRGQCDYYVLPAYPAAACLIGLYIAESSGKSATVAATIAGGALLLAGLAAPPILSIATGHQPLESFWILPAALIVCGALALVTACSRQLLASMTALFGAICLAGIGFAFQVLPSLSALQPLDLFATDMRATPAFMRIGVHKALGHWVDELTFQAERNPVDLTGTADIERFFLQGPGIALIPKADFEAAVAHSEKLRAMRLSVLEDLKVCLHPLTPGYVYKHNGNLPDTELVLVEN